MTISKKCLSCAARIDVLCSDCAKVMVAKKLPDSPAPTTEAKWPTPPNKYSREIKPGVFVDVYDVCRAFNVTCPAMAQGIKKCLAPGQRGVKDSLQGKKEAIASIKRSIELEAEKCEPGTVLE